MQPWRFCTSVTAICVTLYFTWSVAGDADEPGSGFPIPNLLVCPALPLLLGTLHSHTTSDAAYLLHYLFWQLF